MPVQTLPGTASSPVEFLDKMTSFAVPCVAFAIAFIAIIALQILYFQKDNILFLIGDWVLGLAGIISSLVTMNYYSTFAEIFEANKAYMTAAQLAECPNITLFSLVCIVIALAFVGSMFLTLVELIVKKILDNR